MRASSLVRISQTTLPVETQNAVTVAIVLLRADVDDVLAVKRSNYYVDSIYFAVANQLATTNDNEVTIQVVFCSARIQPLNQHIPSQSPVNIDGMDIISEWGMMSTTKS